MKLEDLQPDAAVHGILADEIATVVSVRWFGSDTLELTYKTSTGRVVDGAVQQHLYDRACKEVVVYYSGSTVR